MVSWVDSFQRETEVEVASSFKPSGIEQWEDDFRCGTLIASALQNNQLRFPKARTNCFYEINNVKKIRSRSFAQRGRHSNENDILHFQQCKIICRSQLS
jgi:hypothetical protein